MSYVKYLVKFLSRDFAALDCRPALRKVRLALLDISLNCIRISNIYIYIYAYIYVCFLNAHRFYFMSQ